MNLPNLWKQVQISESSVDITIHSAFTIYAGFMQGKMHEECSRCATREGPILKHSAEHRGPRWSIGVWRTAAQQTICEVPVGNCRVGLTELQSHSFLFEISADEASQILGLYSNSGWLASHRRLRSDRLS